jgi:hypothetical protein
MGQVERARPIKRKTLSLINNPSFLQDYHTSGLFPWNVLIVLQSKLRVEPGRLHGLGAGLFQPL